MDMTAVMVMVMVMAMVMVMVRDVVFVLVADYGDDKK